MTDAPQEKSIEDRARETIERFRPYIQADGGDIEFVGIADGGIAQVRLQGACVGCPHAAMTLKAGVEQHLREAVPEINGVENVG